MKKTLFAVLVSLPLLGTCAPGAYRHVPPGRTRPAPVRLPPRARPAPRPGPWRPPAPVVRRPRPLRQPAFGIGLFGPRLVWVPGRWETVAVPLPGGGTSIQTVWIEGRYVQVW